MKRKIIGSILIGIGVAVALHQIVAYHVWEWEQMISPIHHEGIALITIVLGLILWATTRKRGGA